MPRAKKIVEQEEPTQGLKGQHAPSPKPRRARAPRAAKPRSPSEELDSESEEEPTQNQQIESPDEESDEPSPAKPRRSKPRQIPPTPLKARRATVIADSADDVDDDAFVNMIVSQYK